MERRSHAGAKKERRKIKTGGVSDVGKSARLRVDVMGMSLASSRQRQRYPFAG